MTTRPQPRPAKPSRRNARREDGTLPHVAVATELLDAEHAVIRETDDTDTEYEARSRLLAAALNFARRD
jgi:hypothetical protein